MSHASPVFFINHLRNYDDLSTETTSCYVNLSAPRFHKNIKGYKPTPLVELPGLAASIGVDKIFIKDESKRFHLKAFKCLGASFGIHSVIGNKGGSEFDLICSATDGNHGRAVAWYARQIQKKCVILVPIGTTQQRIEAIRSEGAEVIIVKGDYDTTVEIAFQYSIENNGLLVQDTAFDNYELIPQLIMQGYTTMMEEIREELEIKGWKNSFDLVLIQSGNGTWGAAVASYLHSESNNSIPQIISVEPFESDCCFSAVFSGKIIQTQKSQKTMMAGLNCGTISKLAFPIYKSVFSGMLLLKEEHTINAMRLFASPLKSDAAIESVESGAAGLAGLMALTKDKSYADLKEYLGIGKRSRVLIFNTEGITDQSNYDKIVKRQLNFFRD